MNITDMQVEKQTVLGRLTQEIYELAGEFNINSPKQLEKAPLRYTEDQNQYSTCWWNA